MRPSARPVRRARSSVLVLATCALAGCSGSGYAPPSTAPDLTLHQLPTCSAGAAVPDDVSLVTPSASSPPTSVLKVGQAVAFVAPAGSTVHSAGTADRPAGNVVCQSAQGSGTQRRAVILGLGPGFVQVALVPAGSKKILRTLVTVTN